MSKVFKNLKTGLLEKVFNKAVIAQCESHPEAWEVVEVKAPKKEETEEVKQPKKSK